MKSNPILIRLAIFSFVFLGLLEVQLPQPALAAQPPTSKTQLRPLAELLNSDGTLNLSTGFNGSLDLSGWQVVLDATRGPVFTPLSGESRSAARPTGLPARSAAGDGPLATQEIEGWLPFPNGGMDNIGTDYGVYALAVVGPDIYVGGASMETADGLVKDLNCIAKFDSLTSTWSALPNKGLAGWVEALAVVGSDLYGGTCSSRPPMAASPAWAALPGSASAKTSGMPSPTVG